MPSFGKKASSKPTRLFYATDLHGSERTYRKFLNAGKFYEAQVLIMGGDIIGKIAVPIIQESAGRYRATLQGTTEIIESEEALKALLERIGMLGWYAKVMTEEEFREISADRAKVDALFHQLARQRLEFVDRALRDAPGRHGHQVLRHRRQRRLPRRAGGHEDLRRPDLHRLRRRRRAARRPAHA